MATQRNHQNNFATNLTSNQIAGVTTTPLNSIPSIAAPFSITLDATNLNGKYEIVEVSSKTATNINHPATIYAHTTAEEVRMVVGATELDEFAAKTNAGDDGWISYSTVTPTYTSADAPTYTITFAAVDLTSTMSVGMRVKLTDSTVKYFIITAIAFSTNTVVTLYGGTDYTLSGGALSSFNYSSMKAPLGFPLSPTKWTVEVSDSSARSQASAVNGTWYNIPVGAISFPIGIWNVSYQAIMGTTLASGVNAAEYITLSTANNSESDVDFTTLIGLTVPTGSIALYCSVVKQKILSLAGKTTYYLNYKTTSTTSPSITVQGALSPTVIRAVCAYL